LNIIDGVRPTGIDMREVKVNCTITAVTGIAKDGAAVECLTAINDVTSSSGSVATMGDVDATVGSGRNNDAITGRAGKRVCMP
jgi:hypothetical protein